MDSRSPVPSSPKREQVYLVAIRLDDGRRLRGQIRATVVRAYAAALRQQHQEGRLRFPPIVLFQDERNYWLADGFHRVRAAHQAGLSQLPADVYAGTRRDALLFAVAANTGHGLPRSNADKRQAVEVLLTDPEWGRWSDREIARRCHVSNRLVSNQRCRLSVNGSQMRERQVQRGDSTYTMRTAPADPPAPVDGVGLPVPARAGDVFLEAAGFQEAKDLFGRLAGLLDRLAQGRGGEVYRRLRDASDVDRNRAFACRFLSASYRQLLAGEPYCAYCPCCEIAHSGASDADCPTCTGRGWTTRPEFESSPAGYRELLWRRLGETGQAPEPDSPGNPGFLVDPTPAAR